MNKGVGKHQKVRTVAFKMKIRSNKQRRGLKVRLERFTNQDHLGAVNELSWWEFMKRTGENAVPLPPSKAARPDFWVKSPTELLVEVSTLNVSLSERQKLLADQAVALDHAEMLRRILVKVTTEKRAQISYAGAQKKPCALVLFDYTWWSGFETQPYRFLAEFLLTKQVFRELPSELSALVYVLRKVIDGRIAMSRERSAIYYNPNATYPLPMGTFVPINQFWCQMAETEAQVADPWIWLSE